MTEETGGLDQLIDDIDSTSTKKHRVLTQLLDEQGRQQGKLFALKTEMGYTLEDTGRRIKIPTFLVTQTLDWIGKEMLMGSEMPFMQNYIDKKGRLIVNESIAESVKQRAPDWTRQPAISAYLAHDKRRKFGTIVAVLNPSWVDDPTSENWVVAEGQQRALRSAYRFTALDSRGLFGLLDIEDTQIYALDGQHRVMGIRGIQELRDGVLTLRNRDGQSKNKSISKPEFLDQFHLTITDLQSLLNETMAVELIPAVLAGESALQASQRIRSVFITINSYAQKTGKGENALLDESNGFALVARKAGTLHPLFKEDRVNWKTSSLPTRTRWYTTLDTLVKMATDYLSLVEGDLTKTWEPRFSGQVPVRPEEKEIEQGKDTFFLFLDNLMNLPVFQGLERGDLLDSVRLFPSDAPEGRGHLLTRPVGQTILTKAVAGLLVGEKKMAMEKIFAGLSKWDRLGGFSQHLPGSVWYGVTYDIVGKKMNTRTDEEVAARLLKYMVHGADEKERAELLEFLVEARTISRTIPDKPKWVTFEGKEEEYDPANPTKGKMLPILIDNMADRP